MNEGRRALVLACWLALLSGALGCNQMLGIREGKARPGLHGECGDDCDAGVEIPEGCGDGMLGMGEVCDGDCPSSCDDGIACTEDTLTGSPRLCNARCESKPIEVCVSGDGCCPAACDHSSDSDCSSQCGNGAIDALETCDGNCPTSCDDAQACTLDLLTGSAENCSATCSFVPVSECVTGDGCCPSACDPSNDGDCSSTCGNDVVEPPETCDGNCPFLCLDGDFCTIDYRLGSAWTCSAVCAHTQIVTCQHDDGCCPAGCNALADDDCPAVCGNQLVEPGESCDGNCPTSCADGDACTNDSLTGDADRCTAACPHKRTTTCVGGDGCCPSTCDFHVDGDCPAVFARRKELVIDASLVQAPGGGSLTSFPVLVSMNDADLAAAARPDGRDIFFAAADGVTLLDFEIDTWNAGTLIAWVRIPSLSSSVDTRFFVYYGDGKAWNRADADAVWDASFAGVWHLGNDPGPGNVGDLRDASGAGHHGTAPSAYTSSDLVSGQVGRAIEVSAGAGAIDVGDIDSLDAISRMTVSAWVRFDALADSAGIVLQGNTQDGWFMGLGSPPNDALAYVRVNGSSSGPDGSTSDGFVTTTASLHLWTLVFDGNASADSDKLRLFIDGTQKPLSIRGPLPDELPATSASVLLGSGFSGVLDEVLLSTTVRSPEWIATYFANLASPLAFVSRGPEQRM